MFVVRRAEVERGEDFGELIGGSRRRLLLPWRRECWHGGAGYACLYGLRLHLSGSNHFPKHALPVVDVGEDRLECLMEFVVTRRTVQRAAAVRNQ